MNTKNNNYAETKRIPLEEATKEELVAGIKAIWSLDAVKQAEQAIYWARQQSLLDQMRSICDKIDELRVQPNAYDAKQIAKRTKLRKDHQRIFNKLSKLQGIF